MLSSIQGEINYARMLISRLERLSVDSFWAHRASGLRGSLLRALDRFEALAKTEQPDRLNADVQHLRDLINRGAEILDKAAREIRGDEH